MYVCIRGFEKAFTLKEVEIQCVPGAYLTVSHLSTDLKDFLGNFIITIILTMPVSTATPQRSFSRTIRAERSSGLTLLHTFRDVQEHRHRQGGPGVLRWPRPYILECHANTALSLRSS